MLDRIFGKNGCMEGGNWWIAVLFFLFLAFQDCWKEIEICDWIPFLILLLIACSYSGLLEDDGCCH